MASRHLIFPTGELTAVFKGGAIYKGKAGKKKGEE